MKIIIQLLKEKEIASIKFEAENSIALAPYEVKINDPNQRGLVERFLLYTINGNHTPIYEEGRLGQTPVGYCCLNDWIVSLNQANMKSFLADNNLTTNLPTVPEKFMLPYLYNSGMIF